MKRLFAVALLALLTLSFVVVPTSDVKAQESPIGISIFNPIQYPDEATSIRGIRLNVLYGVNQDLTGVDFGYGLPFNFLRGDLTGIQLGIYNEVGGSASGIQWGFVNWTMEDHRGLQLSAINLVDGQVRGAQIGVLNDASHVRGLQFGLANMTETLNGVQIGLINLKADPGPGFPDSVPYTFFPFVNWTF